jgi:hypothetical protein
MGICWYCCWGWPRVVRAIYEKYSRLVSDASHVLDYGPGHIVWADENFETEHIQWCLDNAEEWREHKWDEKWPQNMKSDGLLLEDRDFHLAIESLRELLAIPESVRCCEPRDYDERNPENYPPPAEIEWEIR